MSATTVTLFAALQQLKLPIPSIPDGPHASISDVTERAMKSIPQEKRIKRAYSDPQLVPKLVQWLKDFLGDTPATPAVIEVMDEMRAPKLDHPWVTNMNETRARTILSTSVCRLVSAIIRSLHQLGGIPALVDVGEEEAFEGLKPDFTIRSLQDPPKRLVLEAKHPKFMVDVGTKVNNKLINASGRGCKVSWKLNLPPPSRLLLKSGVYMSLTGSNWAFVSSHNDWLVMYLASLPEPYLVVSQRISLTPINQDVIVAFVSALIMTMLDENIEVPKPDMQLSPIPEADDDEEDNDEEEQDKDDDKDDDGSYQYPKGGPSSDRDGDNLPPAGRHTRVHPGPLFAPLYQYLSATFRFPHHDQFEIFKLKSVGAPINPLAVQVLNPVKKPQLEIREEIGHGALSYVFKASLFGSPVVAKIIDVTSSRELWKQDSLLGEYRQYLYLSTKEPGGVGNSLLGVAIPRCYGIYQGKNMHVLLLSDEGQPLESWSQLDSARRAQLFSHLCDLHAAGLVHADLEPRNVLVRENGKLCIIDLDQAGQHRCKDLKRLQGHQTKTKTWRCLELQVAADELGLSFQ